MSIFIEIELCKYNWEYCRGHSSVSSSSTQTDSTDTSSRTTFSSVSLMGTLLIILVCNCKNDDEITLGNDNFQYNIDLDL